MSQNITTKPTDTKCTHAITGEVSTCIGVFVDGELISEHSSQTLADAKVAFLTKTIKKLNRRK